MNVKQHTKQFGQYVSNVEKKIRTIEMDLKAMQYKMENSQMFLKCFEFATATGRYQTWNGEDPYLHHHRDEVVSYIRANGSADFDQDRLKFLSIVVHPKHTDKPEELMPEGNYTDAHMLMHTPYGWQEKFVGSPAVQHIIVGA